MPNDMRDRLMKLLNQVRGNEIALADYEADILIDHLLANGVILPPCKVGDTVYCINTFSSKDTRINKCVVDALHITSGKNQRGHKKPSYAIVRDEDIPYLSTRIYFEKFGKTVFLTREDAEKALKERESK